MAIRADLTEVTDQHRTIEKQIIEEMGRPLVDDLKVSKLKRDKLRLKEEIAALDMNSKIVA